MMQARSDVMSRLGGSTIQTIRRRVPKVEYVNRAGERVNPHNGKPYARLTSASTISPSRKRTRSKIRGTKTKLENKLPVKMFGIMFGGLEPIPTNPTVDPPPRVCYNCWQPRHSRKNCPRPVVAKICNNCGRRGEDLSTCPRCRVAHLKYLAHLNGEKLDQHDLDELFPRGYNFAHQNGVESEADRPYDEVLQQLIEPREGDYHVYEEHEEQEAEAYREPQVKYVETREYVKNPVSRYRRESEEEDRRYDDYEHERSYDREGSQRPREDSEERYRRNNASFSDLDSDPVQEVLQLAKSIAHLSAETQELIMRQVMAERKEKARLRALKYKEEVEPVEEDLWQ